MGKGGGFMDSLKGLAQTGLAMAPALLASQGKGGRRTRGGQLIDTSGGSIMAAGGRKLTSADLNRIKQMKL
jgi:hypothetical protein